MMKKITALALALVMVVSICCSCAASSSTDATPEKDSTTESTKETTTTDTSTTDTSEVVRQDSSTPAETETADTTETDEVTDPILSDENIDKLYALVAYNINHEYLEPNNMAKVEFKWLTEDEWFILTASLETSFNSQINPEPNINNGMNVLSISAANYLGYNDTLDLIALIFKDIFYSYQKYFTQYPTDEFLNVNWEEQIPKNVSFSEDQLKLGEEVAQEISELEAE